MIETFEKRTSIIRDKYVKKRFTITLISLFENTISSIVVIKNNTFIHKWWSKPPIQALYKIKIFNYTNFEDFKNGKADKLKVEEVGPYIYREILTRVEQKFHDNGTISFREKREFQFLGGRSVDEIVTVPNVPLLSAMSMARNSPFVFKFGLSLGFSIFGDFGYESSGPFLNLTVSQFLWGYDDSLFSAAKSFSPTRIPFDKFGVLAYKNGISSRRITMNTGQINYQKFGLIEKIDGVDDVDMYNDKICDTIYGTDGTIFPSIMFRKPDALMTVYIMEMCRTLQLTRVGTGTSFGMPTLIYQIVPDSFIATPTEHSCFCSKKNNELTCPPAGIFIGSPKCTFGTSIVTSLPHFYGGDPILWKDIEGINPKKELHNSQIEIHPRLGFMIGGSSKVQMNIEAKRSSSFPFLGKIKDGQIMPIVWADVSVDEIPEPMLTVLWHGYFTIELIETLFKWCSILGIILPIIIFIHNSRQYDHYKNHEMLYEVDVMEQNRLLASQET
ncbi:scavenger receptor class B member 1-like [Aphidius gifuensis]|uniref:scavenger receptor class B member 1-like n=1 Tax=Aphidius gifuensis TaxID=684658 RepID=UPI001CDC6F97|nr:scavenger receptor class B member 1-like [Aphidius gifuensis]